MLRSFAACLIVVFCLSGQTGLAQSSPQIIALVKSKGNGWHYLHENGEIIMGDNGKPLSVEDEVYHFSEGRLMRSQKNVWGFVDTNGHWVVAPMYKSVKKFQNGYARVKNRKWAYIDATGRAITPDIFNRVDDFSEGMAAVKTDNLWGYIDTVGALIIQPKYTGANFFNDGLAAVETTVTGTNKKWTLIDKSGKEVIVPQVEKITYLGLYSHGRIRARLGDSPGTIKWFYINEQGAKVFDRFFKKAEDFREGVARVKEDDEWGFINPDGEYVIEPIYEGAEDFVDGYAKVRFEGKWGIIDKNGEWVCRPEFDYMRDLVNGYTGAEKSGQIGIIDVTGQWVLPPDYQHVISVTSTD